MKKIILFTLLSCIIVTTSFANSEYLIEKFIIFKGPISKAIDVINYNGETYINLKTYLELNQEEYKQKNNVIQILRKESTSTNKYYYPNGDIYIGKIVNGYRQGPGVTYFYDGGKLEGTYKDDKLDGEGKKILLSGDYYIGNFSEGFFNGSGEYHFVNGDVYKGNFIYGIREGVGSMYYKNEDTYKGQWKNNVFHGYGALRTDSLKQGEWNDGNFVRYAPAEKINEALKSTN